MDDRFKQITDKYIGEAVRLILAEVMQGVRAQMGLKRPYRKLAATDRRCGPAEPKPCPVCGLLNKGRRFRFYCEAHRDQMDAAK